MELIGVSQKIRMIRECFQMSLAELAGLLNVSESAIQAIEEGQQELSTKVLQRLVEKLNVSADWLLSDIGEMFISQSPWVKSSTSKYIVLKGKQNCQEKVLDNQISILEERLQKETNLPLKQIRFLLTKFLNLPEQACHTTSLPDEFSPGNWQNLSYEEKKRYYQELRAHMNDGQQEFSKQFQKLVQLVCGRNS